MIFNRHYQFNIRVCSFVVSSGGVFVNRYLGSFDKSYVVRGSACM